MKWFGGQLIVRREKFQGSVRIMDAMSRFASTLVLQIKTYVLLVGEVMYVGMEDHVLVGLMVSHHVQSVDCVFAKN